MSRLNDILKAITNPFGKQLWSGEWTSGTKTITNGSKYCAYIIVVNGIPCIAVRDGDQIRGFNVATTTLQNQYAKAVQITINGDSWTLDSSRQLNHNASGNHNAGADMPVNKIIGLVPSWGGVLRSSIIKAFSHFFTCEEVAA